MLFEESSWQDVLRSSQKGQAVALQFEQGGGHTRWDAEIPPFVLVLGTPQQLGYEGNPIPPPIHPNLIR
jgi:hypothetical protein